MAAIEDQSAWQSARRCTKEGLNLRLREEVQASSKELAMEPPLQAEHQQRIERLSQSQPFSHFSKERDRCRVALDALRARTDAVEAGPILERVVLQSFRFFGIGSVSCGILGRLMPVFISARISASTLFLLLAYRFVSDGIHVAWLQPVVSDREVALFFSRTVPVQLRVAWDVLGL